MSPTPATDALARLRRARAIVAVMTAAGFAVTVWLFHPGVMTYDARYVYGAIHGGTLGDWQSPAMTWLWGLIDPLVPGPPGMFLLIAALYWAGFCVVALTVARARPRPAMIVPLLALVPPAFIPIGVIWRDMLFGGAWLMAGALAYAGARERAAVRAPLTLVALALFGFGVLLRPNALLAAPLLLAAIAWPREFSFKRAALAYVPAVVALFGLVQVVYYGALGAERQNPLHSVFVYDLGGITHFSGENAFPVAWPPDQEKLLTTTCYSPLMWDTYWYREPCPFVMARLEKQEHLFGTPALARAWIAAIARHPLAYLAHRTTVFWAFLTGDNLVVWFHDLDDPTRIIRADDRAFMALKAVHDALKATPLFRMGLWLVLVLAVTVAGWRRRATPAGTFAVGVAGSAAIYLLTYWPVAVAVDFRYGYWAVLAALAGGAAIGAAEPAPAAA